MAKKRRRPKKPIEPIHVFLNAFSFKATSMALDSLPEKHIFQWPMVVNEAFALELSIKALHRVRRRYTTGHDVEALFAELSAADKREIDKLYSAIIVQHPYYDWAISQGIALDRESVLLRSKDAFPRIRYWHDYLPMSRDAKGMASNAGVGSLIDAIFERILTLMPKWRHMAIRSPGLAESTPPTTLLFRQTPELPDERQPNQRGGSQ
jgi:hypothetical protein